jgi:hypothetical protein
MYSVLSLVISTLKDKSTYNANMESNKEIISRLKFIGRLQKGEKINVRRMFVQQDGYVTAISRALINQDNRNNTLSFVQNIITRAFELVTLYERSEKESDHVMCSNLIKDLHNCKGGLSNLKDTYISDIKFCCDMDTFLQLIDARLTDLASKYTPVQVNSDDN